MPSAEFTFWGLRDHERGRRNLESIESSVSAAPFETITALLSRYLPMSPDPDRALNNLDRLLATPAGRDRLPDLLAADGRGMADLLAVLGTSQFFADTLFLDPEAMVVVLVGPSRSPSTQELIQSLKSRIEEARDDARLLKAFRRFRREQLLRIGANDLIRDRPLEEITRDLARVADSCIAVAVTVAMKSLAKQFGMPTGPDGQPAKLTALAFGKLGGDELNYSSDLDLMFVYDYDGETTGKKAAMPNAAFFSKVVSEVVRYLSVHTESGFAYRVDLRLRPEGQRGALAKSFAATRSYYDVSGRTWERQALIKLRHCGGDQTLGLQFIEAIQPFIYRKYFSFSEINEVKALKRQMETRATRSGLDERDVKTGRGGIRDIEYTVQFLQLLNGGDIPAIRQRNTLLALESLEIAGCLTQQETFILADAYRFLRKVEHRLQLLFDFQTHRLPDDANELQLLSRKMNTTVEKFSQAFREKTRLDRTILDHLLHQTFADSTDRGEPESDLILDPNPDMAAVAETLDRYRFRDTFRAYQNLLRLARESVPFLSARRCRHFLASIAPALLQAVSLTPDPDGTLENLEKVTESLGAKAVLYELFSVNQASLKLYVDLCAGSPYLSSLLMNNPGMIDELLDSLVLDRPRTMVELKDELAELLRGADDPDPILFSFRDKELLRIGVRDLLNKEQIRETTAALSDLADSVVNAAFDLAERELAPRFGKPLVRRTNEAFSENGHPKDMPLLGQRADQDAKPLGQAAVIGLGKLGGQEIGYHSDVDLLVIFDGDHALSLYMTELTQRAIRLLSKAGPHGKLYSVDMRLRPFGKSSSLVIALDEFLRYGESDSCQTWERQALTRARILKTTPGFDRQIEAVIHHVILAKPWSTKVAQEIAAMREKLIQTGHNFKRGTGGIVDIEFMVQLLQIKYGATKPEILKSNMWDALQSLKGIIPDAERTIFVHAYNYLRTIESRIRIVSDRPSVELPTSPEDRDRLARRLGHVTGESLVGELDRVMTGVRWAYELLMNRETVVQ